jgi:hypothetical protein
MKGEERLTPEELRGPHIVFLEDGRRFEVPVVVYEHIRSAAFRHGVDWARAHPEPPDAVDGLPSVPGYYWMRDEGGPAFGMRVFPWPKGAEGGYGPLCYMLPFSGCGPHDFQSLDADSMEFIPIQPPPGWVVK